MTQARSHIVPSGSDGLYHCVQRCVRRAFRCGADAYSGRSFEHGKSWIEQRLGLLAESFAVSTHAYAVLIHHLHVALQLARDAVAGWSDADVAARWARLFPPLQDSENATEAKCRHLVDDPERLQTIRGRLCDPSWLMRRLAEPINRQANREDRCKGRFGEGRFKAPRLCNERAILAAMAYVDLNPVQAGIADGLEDSAHTSIAARIASAGKTAQALDERLGPILGVLQPPLAITTVDCLQLLD